MTLQFRRPSSFWRKFKPKNVLGLITGYGSCECGNTFRGEVKSFDTSPHGGRLICPDCYQAFEPEISKHNHRVASEPGYQVGGMIGYLICSNQECWFHRSDPRFEWKGSIDKSALNQTIEKYGPDSKEAERIDQEFHAWHWVLTDSALRASGQLAQEKKEDPK